VVLSFSSNKILDTKTSRAYIKSRLIGLGLSLQGFIMKDQIGKFQIIRCNHANKQKSERESK